MLSKLEYFKTALEAGEVSSTMSSRLYFTKNEKSRAVAMHRIQSGTKKLERLLGTTMDLFDQQSRASRKRAPSTRTRRYSDALYRKLAIKWPRIPTGSSQTRHVARLCLWNCCCDDERNGSDDSLDMVFAMVDRDQGKPKWQESTIHVKETNGLVLLVPILFCPDFS